MRAQPPTHRPTWLVVLSSMMLLAAGYALVQGLVRLRNPAAVLRIGGGAPAESATELDLRQQLRQARAAAVAAHEPVIRVEAGAAVAVALLALYATAALLAHDRHGRTLTLVTAAAVIVYQLGTVLAYLGLIRDFAARSAPVLAAMALLGSDSAPPLPGTSEGIAFFLTFWHVLTAGLGIAGALLLLTFFGGRRGRTLYGLAIGAAPTSEPGSR